MTVAFAKLSFAGGMAAAVPGRSSAAIPMSTASVMRIAHLLWLLIGRDGGRVRSRNAQDARAWRTSVRRRSVLGPDLQGLDGHRRRRRLGQPRRLAVLAAVDVDRGEVASDLEEELVGIDVELLVHDSTFPGTAQDPLNA